MYHLILLRHGESVWNKENRFTGWTDIGLSNKGVEEAVEAGSVLRQEGCRFDVAFTSVLKRAIKTLWVVLEQMDRMWIPVHCHWRLNERHYGALQGANKAETADRFGEDQVHLWRRSYDVRPPALTPDDERYPGKDPRYSHLPPQDIPLAESLEDTVSRVLPYWHAEIVPVIRSGKQVIIASHGNCLRALIKHIDGLTAEQIVKFSVPTGAPMQYDLDDELRPIRRFYVGHERSTKFDAAV